jgi:protein-S-isoprenylcysteine O-methyltransferase Ste14
MKHNLDSVLWVGCTATTVLVNASVALAEPSWPFWPKRVIAMFAWIVLYWGIAWLGRHISGTRER